PRSQIPGPHPLSLQSSLPCSRCRDRGGRGQRYSAHDTIAQRDATEVTVSLEEVLLTPLGSSTLSGQRRGQIGAPRKNAGSIIDQYPLRGLSFVVRLQNTVK